MSARVPSRPQTSSMLASLASPTHSGWNCNSPFSTRLAIKPTTEPRWRPRRFAISRNERPSPSKRMGFFGWLRLYFKRRACACAVLELRQDLQNLLPVAFGFLRPVRAMPRMFASDAGRRRQISSSELSCMTTKEATLFSFATPRRHSRRYSRNSGSTSGGISTRGDPGAATCRCVALASVEPLRRLARPVGAGADKNAGKPLHTSQASHEVHFGVSPKCRQISR